MQSVIGALRVNLGLDSAEFTKGLRRASKSLKGVGRSLTNIGRDMSLSVTAPIVAFGGLAIKAGADFEASMNRVQAATGASAIQFVALAERAKELGKTTQFSASQAADAIEVLAKNGLDASEILGGALEASLLLAASSGSNLSGAADISTDVMLQFGKTAKELPALVDTITGVLLESKFGIDDFRLALGQAGGVAGGLGVEFEDFAAAIAATSSAFTSGSDAGTSFKTFIQRLVPASGPAAAAMEELGVSFFDAQGQMKTMAEIAQELQNGLEGLSEEARNDSLSTIFGRDAMRTAIGLANEGADGIERVTAALKDASAADQAAARLKGFSGEMKKLVSAFEAFQIAIADSGVLEMATKFVVFLTDLTSRLSDADPQLVRFGVTVAAIGAALGPLAVAAGLVLTVLGGPAIGIIAAVTLLTAGFIAFQPQIIAAKDAVVSFVRDGLEYIRDLPAEILAAFKELPAQMLEIGGDIMSGLRQGIANKIESVKGAISDTASGLVTSIKGKLGIQSPSKVFKEIGGYIMEGLGIGIVDGAKDVESKAKSITDGISSDFKSLFKSVLLDGGSFKEGLGNIFDSLASKMFDSGLNSLFSIIPGFAGGTSYAPGGMALVGERGPELVNLPRGSQVRTAAETSRMFGGAGEPSRVIVTLDNEMLNASITQGAGQVVRQSAPGIVKQSVGASQASFTRSKSAWSP